MDLCRNPRGSGLTGPETWRDWPAHTGGSFPRLWQHVIERSDVIEGVTAQHSDRDSVSTTLLVFFPVVGETCWDIFSNKNSSKPPGCIPVSRDHTFDPESTWVHSGVQKDLPREQLWTQLSVPTSFTLNYSAQWPLLSWLTLGFIPPWPFQIVDNTLDATIFSCSS